MTYNITLTANHQSLTAEYLPLAAESVQYLTAKVVCETEDWTGREIKAMFGQGCTVYEVPVTGGEITANQQLNLTAGDWRVWLVGNSARDGDVIPRITTNVAHISVAPTGGTEGNPFPATPPTVEEQLRADMGNLADLTTEDKSSLVAAINEAAASGGSKDAVTYTPQTLTEEQKSQARTNIGAEKAGTGYTKPASGIPKSDLAEDVQTSLAKADTAIQSQTIPDWNQNDETAPDYVKNRPFYTGDPVETVLVEESTVSFAENHGLYMAQFPSTFEATVGETYKVYWDGTAYECACVNFNDQPAIGNLSIIGAGSDTGEPFVMVILNGEGIAIVTPETSASHTVSISATAVVVVKIDEKYLPDTVATKSEVEATQEVLDGVFSSVVTFTFDKQTSGRDTFVFNAFNYYKISDFNPAPENVISFKGTRENGAEWSEITIGNNCVEYGLFIVVASAGSCSLPITETDQDRFTAPSAGLYARYKEGNQNMTAGTGEFTLRGSTGSFPITGLLLKSSTADSSKKFKITVDDSGTITATEVS